jgi:ABC-type bacteriocin/lantibiotic exporter with double-glycine peptidase domain
MAAVCVLVTGCYAGTARKISPARVATESGWEFVRDVPFVAQRGDDECGPAALAMVLTYHQLPTTPAEILVEAPARSGGVTAGELRDLARRRGFEAFVFAGTWDDLEGQIRHQHPVVVGLLQPMWGVRARAHFEVVVGINRAKRRVLSLDPARGWREDSVEGFAGEWAAAGRLTLAITPRPWPATIATTARRPTLASGRR